MINKIYDYLCEYPKFIIDIFIKYYYEEDIEILKKYLITGTLDIKTEKSLKKIKKELKEVMTLLEYRPNIDLNFYFKKIYGNKKAGTDMKKQSIYNYFNFPKNIIDLALSIIKNEKIKLELKECDYKKINSILKNNPELKKYITILENNLKYISFRYCIGYSLDNIKESLNEKKLLPIRLKEYKNTKEILNRININYDKVLSLLNLLPKEYVFCYQHYYGFSEAKLRLVEIASILNINTEEVKKRTIFVDSYLYINGNDKISNNDRNMLINFLLEYMKKENKLEKIDNLKNTNIKYHNVSNKKGRKRKDNFLDYFDEDNKYLVLEIIDTYKAKNHDYYQTLTKLYGDNYDKLNENVKLTKEEIKNFNIFRQSINSKILKSKQEHQIEKVGKKRKDNFLDYFSEDNKNLVLEIIDIYKAKNNNYYQTLVKLYGENYDKLNKNVKLTRKELISINNLKQAITKKIEIQKYSNNLNKKNGRKRKASFFDYFSEDNKNLVLEIIDTYKAKNNNYYQTLIKMYGENYDKLNKNVKLTRKEQKSINNLKQAITKKIEIQKYSNNLNKKNGRKRKASFFDYFSEDNKNLVLEIIDTYKAKNHDYYQTLTKLYGDNYDKLNENVKLTKEEIKNFNIFRQSINSKILKSKQGHQIEKAGRKRKDNFLDYFDEDNKNLVLEIIDTYKAKNHDYYQTLTKLYGENYNKLNKNIKLTKKELRSINNLKQAITKKIEIQKCSNNLNKKNILKRKDNFLDYFDEDNKNLVLEIIDIYKAKNNNYYQTLIKLYGDNYDKLNKNVKLTKKELKSISNLKQAITKKIEIQKYSNNLNKKKGRKRKDSFFDYFNEDNKNLVLEIIDIYKAKNHDYYQTLTKLYGDNYNKLNENVKLTKRELESISNLKQAITKKIEIQKYSNNLNKKKGRKRKDSFFDYFNEDNKNLVLEIIDIYKAKNHDYYQTLTKLYGDNYNKLNENVKLTKRELENLINFRLIINKKIKQNINNNSKFKNLLSKYSFLNNLKENELIIIKCIVDKNMSIQKISDLIDLDIKHIDYFLIKNLAIFEEKIPDLLKAILERNNYSIDEIINYSFLKEEFNYLTNKEKLYLYLKLKSYQNSNINDEVILDILSLEKEDINKYKIMTKSNLINNLNKLIK